MHRNYEPNRQSAIGNRIMTFAHAHILWLLLVILPALALFFWWAWRERQRLMTQFIQARLLPGLISGVSPARQKLRLWCLALAVTFTLLALARPQWGFTWEETKQRGLDIIVAVDTSKSMLAEDIAPNRLTRAKLAALDLMQQARSDRLGLVAFSGSAFLQCPLTIDDTVFRQSVETLDINTISQGGTALAEAINTARTAFKEGDNHKVLVLFTDGEDNDEGALEAAREAAKDGLRIFTIGIGTPEGELLRITDLKGRMDYIRDSEGNVVKSRLNETLLQQIAGATEGGFYLPLRGAKSIDTLYEKGLAPLPKGDQTTRLIKRQHERYHWPLGIAILLLFLEMLLPERKRASKRAAALAGRTDTVLRGVATALAVVLLPASLLGSPSSALREYQSGKYDAALKEYQRALQRKADDPRLHFNAGAAAYQNQQFEEAAKQFNEALAAQDLQLQQSAYYNLGNTLYRQGDTLSDPNQKMELWQNALKLYEGTLKLDPQDADAKFNRDFVKQRLEELKQQQQQQQQNQNQDQQQEQQDQQDQQQQPNQQDQQDQQQQDQQSQPQPDDQSQQQEPQQQPAKSPEDQQEGKPGEQEDSPPATPTAPQAMTPQEARQLLDAQKGEERFLQFKPPEKPSRGPRLIKDW
ncbi:MAG: VWA domain-containing protein [Verrucomicrobia bacterium]|nr:VWA domain-containing protein [Verrucomicrobiota bacterium]